MPVKPIRMATESMSQEKVAFIKSFSHFGLRPPMMCCQPLGVWKLIRQETTLPFSPGSGAISSAHGST